MPVTSAFSLHHPLEWRMGLTCVVWLGFWFLSCLGWDIKQISCPQHPANYNITVCLSISFLDPKHLLSYTWICPFLSHENKMCSHLLLCPWSQIWYTCTQLGFFWYCLLILAGTKLISFPVAEKRAMLWICAFNIIARTGTFLLLLSSACTVSRSFLLLIPLYWGGGWRYTSWEKTHPGQQTPADREIQMSFVALSVCATCHVQLFSLPWWINIPSASTWAVVKWLRAQQCNPMVFYIRYIKYHCTPSFNANRMIPDAVAVLDAKKGHTFL